MNDEQASSQALGSASHFCDSDARWPARTQRLLGELRALCGNWLHEPLRRSLDHFDMRLHGQSEHTRSHLDQQHYQATHQKLLNERDAFDQRFIASIDQAFNRLGMPILKPVELVPQTLSLLDPLEHELTAALDQLVARSEARGGPQLVELGYRFAVLIGTSPLESDALPVGPQAMAKAFREASHTLGLPSMHELLLLQSLESSLIEELAPLHELINAHLRADGILPCLRPFALPRASARRDRAKKERLAAPFVVGNGHEPMMVSDNRRKTPTDQSANDDGNLLRGGGAVTDEELQIALAALQEHLSQADERTRFDLSHPQRLREELLIQLTVGCPVQTPRACLSIEQDDAIEMIVRLFGKIAQQLPQTGDARSLLCDLQLPMLRIALADHEFFEQQEHPARKVLGKIAEIAHDWLDDTRGAIDRSLRIKLGQLIERTGREPPSAALYVSLQDDIEQYLIQLQHKTQLAERRQVDAMQGLERLEQARHRVAELLAKRSVKSSSQNSLLARLDHAWSDVLALTLLRHGEQSQIFGTRLAVTDQLLGRLAFGHRHKLQHEIEAGLRQIGLRSDEVVEVAQRMIDMSQHELASDALGVSAPIMHHGQHRHPLHEMVDTASPNSIADAFNVEAVRPSQEVLRMHRHLRALPTGMWFEFIDPSGGRGARHRLVWYSPLTGHSLFVTRSGQRAEELGELRLAHEIVRGRVREIASDHEDVLDHAWRAVTQELGRRPRPITLGGSS